MFFQINKTPRVVVFALLFSLSVVSAYAAAVQDRHELILLHTNDHHGAVLPQEGQGGLAMQASFIKAVRGANKNVLLLDAGGINMGSTLSNIFDAEPDILAYNLMGYDAAVFGVDEFNGGLPKLERQMEIADFPFISANVKTEEGDYLGNGAYIVKDYSGFSVGIFGITTQDAAKNLKSGQTLVFEDEIAAAKQAVAHLRNFEKVDVVIGLVHMGNKKTSGEHITSIELAEAVPGIDIIVDGYSRSYIDEPIFTGHTYIVTAASFGRYMGWGRIVVKGGKLDSFDWKPIAIGPDPDVEELLTPYIALANEEFREILGKADAAFDYGDRLPRYGETALGNLIADAASWQLKEADGLDIDFVLFNSGIIRNGIPEGEITYDTLFSALPIANYLYIVSLSGAELSKLASEIAALPAGDAAFPIFSNELKLTLNLNDGASEMTIEGSPVDPQRTYYFCVNSSILDGVYEALITSTEQVKTSLTLEGALANYIRAKEVIAPETDGRLVLIKE